MGLKNEIMDVDCFLNKKKIRKLKNKKWPWTLTHFILSGKCIASRYSTSYDMPQKPLHFVMGCDDLIKLLHSNFFWCQNCQEFTIYDHYPSDECEVCN